MTGGQLQLASFGNQDVYLTGDPQVTFFKLVYRRYTPFAIESVEQQFSGPVDYGKEATLTLGHSGDLVSAVWLQVAVPDLYTLQYAPTGNAITNTVAVNATNGFFADASGNWYTSPSLAAQYAVAFLNPADGQYYLTRSGTANAYSYSNVVFANVPQDDGSVTPYLAGTLPVTTSSTYANPTWTVRYTNGLGHALLKSAEVQIGGQRVDRQIGEFLDAWSELTEREEKRAGFQEMIGKYDADAYAAGPTRAQSIARTYFVPLKFWFCQTPGLAIPLLALQYHDVKLNFEFRAFADLLRTTGFSVRTVATASGGQVALDVKLFADYVFLDAEERRRYTQIPHEYLFTQTQFLGDEIVNPAASVNPKFALSFSHPVKELVWTYQRYTNYQQDSQTGNDWLNYDMPPAASSPDFFTSLKLQLNGTDRFAARPPGFFRLVQPYQFHTRTPAKRVYCYSFALHPEDAQPSGTCNWSRIDAASLNLTYAPGVENGKLKVYALGYNVLRVANGLAGVAFASG